MSQQRSKSFKVIQQEEALARGIHCMVFELGESAQSVVSCFLRAYRGRVDFVRALPETQGFSAAIEEVRTKLFTGDLEAAERVLGKIQPADDLERGELQIETIRLKRFQGKLDEALSVSEDALRNAALAELSQMTCRQLRGSILLEVKETAKAIEELKIAIALSEIYSLANSAFSARAFLVQAFAESGSKEEAAFALAALKNQVEALDQDELWLDRLLTVLRAEAQFHGNFGDRLSQKKRLLESLEISRWLEDAATILKCERELKELRIEPSERPIIRFSAWTFLPFQNLVLQHQPRKVVRLDKSPIIQKLLRELCGEGLPLGLLFEKVYGYGFDRERHEPHIRAMVSKLRKVLPPGAVSIVDGIVTLV